MIRRQSFKQGTYQFSHVRLRRPPRGIEFFRRPSIWVRPAQRPQGGRDDLPGVGVGDLDPAVVGVGFGVLQLALFSGFEGFGFGGRAGAEDGVQQLPDY